MLQVWTLVPTFSKVGYRVQITYSIMVIILAYKHLEFNVKQAYPNFTTENM